MRTCALFLSSIVLSSVACRAKTEAAPTPRESPAPVAASAQTTSAAAAGPAAKLGDKPLAEVTLADSKTIDKRLATLGWKPMAGCSEATFKGRTVMCTYGERPVTVRLEQKERPVVAGSDVKIGTKTYKNGVLASDGKAHAIIYAGSDGTLDEAKAALAALWDAKAKTLGGEKLASLTPRTLDKALDTKGYGGWSWDPERLFALREAHVIVRKDDPAALEGTIVEDAPGVRLAVQVKMPAGSDPATEKKIADALLGR